MKLSFVGGEKIVRHARTGTVLLLQPKFLAAKKAYLPSKKQGEKFPLGGRREGNGTLTRD